ncbi:hypothetical protein [Rickettsia sp. TH2014]|uniref:hypothetical protein n=1 Tax=Rickettsia sp. TH2014 TaxID=1967503 RepID=UPI001C4952E1|nr:hypothetical protein [Rickettsia sp. TH2014]
MSQNQRSNNESQASLQVEALNNVAVNKHQVNVTMISIVLLIFLIGCCCGHLGSQMLSNYQDKMQILYVSRSEIMDLEKARVEQSQDPAGRMFFGAINKAISLIRREASNYEDNYHHVIFVGDNYVEGGNTKSISKEVYEKVIHQLNGTE